MVSIMPTPERIVLSTVNEPWIEWPETAGLSRVHWQSVQGWAAPKHAVLGNDKLSADLAFRLINAGTAIIWRGDFQNAKQLLAALKRRTAKKAMPEETIAYPERFHLIRQARSQNARALGRLLMPLDADYCLPHRRAPIVTTACEMALGPLPAAPLLMPLTELQGVLSAYEWQRQGLMVSALGERIHARYGVFAPTRHEYLDLINQVALPARANSALDVGSGTGVIAAILAKRGVKHVVATDMAEAALLCTQENVDRLGLGKQIDVQRADLFAQGQFDLVVCNPPWLPGVAKTSLDAAIYDPDGRMLTAFVTGVAKHLSPSGQAWLILSDLAEHLGLRNRQALLSLFEAGGLKVLGRHDINPRHPKSSQANDPLASVRAREVTSLWQLTLA